MTGYIVDDAALVAGLGSGSESQRRELSRLVHDAFGGGPPLWIPALCLAAAATVRPPIVEHVAILVACAVPGILGVRGLAGGQLAELVAEYPGLGFSAAHAATEAIADGLVVVTTDVDRYADIPVAAIAL